MHVAYRCGGGIAAASLTSLVYLRGLLLPALGSRWAALGVAHIDRWRPRRYMTTEPAQRAYKSSGKLTANEKRIHWTLYSLRQERWTPNP